MIFERFWKSCFNGDRESVEALVEGCGRPFWLLKSKCRDEYPYQCAQHLGHFGLAAYLRFCITEEEKCRKRRKEKG